MKPLNQYSYRPIVFIALVAALTILLSPSTVIAQDDSGPYPVEPVLDGTGVLIELKEGAEREHPGKPEVQPLTFDPYPDQFILPDPGPAVPQQLPAQPETPSQPQRPQALPDLVVVDIWSTSNPLQAGQEENVTFQIQNQGTADAATTFLIRLTIDGVAQGAWSAGGLLTGQVAQASATVLVNSVGNQQVKIEVDFDDRIAESNESNNSREETWNWGTSPLDLVVLDIWSTSNPLQAGQEENVTFQIQNQGTAAISTPFLIRLLLDGVPKAAWSSGGLAAGQIAQSGATVIANSVGSHEVIIEVDFDDRIVESNESNNSRVETWSWGTSPADLVVEDIWSATNPLEANHVEEIVYSVRNQGTAAVPIDFHAQLWIDGLPAGTSLISGLAAGASTTRAIEVTVIIPGSHVVEVVVDPAGDVPEANEGNNGRVENWNWVGEVLFLPVIVY